jgi:hypothetical protein
MTLDQSSNTAAAVKKTGEPVPGFPLSFTWSTEWEDIFDAQIVELQGLVRRARDEDRLIVYLSCPISNRGGGWSGTNVDIAKYVESTLTQRWGEAFYILNPAQFQLESKAGASMLGDSAASRGKSLAALLSKGAPGGGDYMRMWTKVLVDDGGANVGAHFDAFYFLGPKDVHAFFMQGASRSLTSSIEGYFAQKCDADSAFRDHFSDPRIHWGATTLSAADINARKQWKQRRMEFLRFYSLRASANFSLGSHDEWAIFRLLNQRRRDRTAAPDMLDGDVGEQLAGFFDGSQLDPGASEAPLSRGNAR